MPSGKGVAGIETWGWEAVRAGCEGVPEADFSSREPGGE